MELHRDVSVPEIGAIAMPHTARKKEIRKLASLYGLGYQRAKVIHERRMLQNARVRMWLSAQRKLVLEAVHGRWKSDDHR